jgi:hypothetical protein
MNFIVVKNSVIRAEIRLIEFTENKCCGVRRCEEKAY